MKQILCGFPLFFLSASLFAQAPTPYNSANDAAQGAAAGASCLACGGGMMVLIVGGIVLGISLLVWVARDAKNRGMDNSVMWMILVFFTNILGLIIYIFARPQGKLIACPKCGNKRLEASAKCPHCGNP
jgi:hypothetical protein